MVFYKTLAVKYVRSVCFDFNNVIDGFVVALGGASGIFDIVSRFNDGLGKV